jgi:hypothetical protein
MFSQTVALCLVFSTHDIYVSADGPICSNTCFFVSTVDSRNDTVSLLGPMFCIAFF